VPKSKKKKINKSSFNGSMWETCVLLELILQSTNYFTIISIIVIYCSKQSLYIYSHIHGI